MLGVEKAAMKLSIPDVRFWRRFHDPFRVIFHEVWPNGVDSACDGSLLPSQIRSRNGTYFQTLLQLPCRQQSGISRGRKYHRRSLVRSGGPRQAALAIVAMDHQLSNPTDC
jgi:hypothetical protein